VRFSKNHDVPEISTLASFTFQAQNSGRPDTRSGALGFNLKAEDRGGYNTTTNSVIQGSKKACSFVAMDRRSTFERDYITTGKVNWKV
jgi:hypothetical protein